MADKSGEKSQGKQTAGALDIRSVIGFLLAVYGVILLVLGLFADTAPEKTGDVNANLWAGIALLVVGVGFLVWVRVRPIVVPEHVDKDLPPPHMDQV